MNRPQEWYEERRRKLGASEVATILGVNQWASPWEVWAVKQGIVEPFGGNEATRAGTILERALLDAAEEALGEKLMRDVESPLDDPDLPLVATLDAITVSRSAVVEAKTAGLYSGMAPGWGDEGRVTSDEQVPLSYYVQVQAQLACSLAPRALIYALLPCRGIVSYEVMPDQEFQCWMITAAKEWWRRHMVDGKEPTKAVGDIVNLDVLKRIRREPESVVEIEGPVGEDAKRMISERAAIKQKMSQDKKLLDAIDANLVSMLGQCEAGLLDDGTSIVFKSQERKGYTVASTTFRSLRINTPKTKVAK